MGLGEVWGKTWHPFQLYCAPGEYLDVWLMNTFYWNNYIFDIIHQAVGLVFWSKRPLVYYNPKKRSRKKKFATILWQISWAILYVTWTEFIYLIFSPRLIGYSAHKQVMRIQLDICEILGQKVFLVCPCGGQGETGPPALWNTRLQR